MVVTWNSGAFALKVRQACVRAVNATAGLVLEEGTRLIASPPKTGRIYHRDAPRRIHQASAPFEAPATDLGNLIASGAIVPDPPDPDRVSTRINWGAPYALDLELGTEKMEPRPFARPALTDVREEFVGIVKLEIKEAVS